MELWYPGAEYWPIDNRPGKHYDKAPTPPKLILHTWEFTNRPPNYTTPPHLTLWPSNFAPGGVKKLWQHIPFDRAAYSITDSDDENDRFVWQIEIAGRAAYVATYPDIWYKEIAEVIQWFVNVQGLELNFADFSVMNYGTYAEQRWDSATFKAFSGICGHGHVGRGSDRHWDPGKISVDRLLKYMTTPMGDDDVLIQDTLKKMTMEWYEALQDKTGQPGGNASYWGSDYTGVKPNQEEWDAATPVLYEAAMRAGVLGPFPASGGAVDSVARATANAANLKADQAHVRLDETRLVVPD